MNKSQKQNTNKDTDIEKKKLRRTTLFLIVLEIHACL